MHKLYRVMLIVLLSAPSMAMKKGDTCGLFSMPKELQDEIFVFFIIKGKPEKLISNIFTLKQINRASLLFSDDILPSASNDYTDIPEKLRGKFNKLSIDWYEKKLSICFGEYMSYFFVQKKHHKICELVSNLLLKFNKEDHDLAEDNILFTAKLTDNLAHLEEILVLIKQREFQQAIQVFLMLSLPYRIPFRYSGQFQADALNFIDTFSEILLVKFNLNTCNIYESVPELFIAFVILKNFVFKTSNILIVGKIAEFLVILTGDDTDKIKTCRYLIFSHLMRYYCLMIKQDGNSNTKTNVQNGFKEIIEKAASYYQKNSSELLHRKRKLFLQSFKSFYENILNGQYLIEKNDDINECLAAYETYFPQNNSNQNN